MASTSEASIPLDEALRMASTYPAKLMNLKENGKIKPGYKADMVVFDKNCEVVLVIKDGKAI